MNLCTYLDSREAALVWMMVLVAIGVPGFGERAVAQLAITEVMSSSARTYQGTNIVAPASDFFELTNFATNGAGAIDLAGYTFTDASGIPVVSLVQPGQEPMSISPGESVVFVRTENTTNYSQFQAWWGPALDPGVQVRFYGGSPGFNSRLGDGVRLYDAGSNLVDSVNFGMARSGFTFMSDTNGDFGVISMPGVCGAQWAATADDLGSPGMACGPVPLRFWEEPAGQTVSAGTRVVLAARATGLPRPRYQWWFKGAAVEGAKGPRLEIPCAGPEHAGRYEVEVENGLTRLRSSPAELTVSTNPAPPVVLSAPWDITVFVTDNAYFAVEASGYPVPSAQWFSNGVALAGETGRTLTVPDCSLEMSGTTYCVELANALHTTNVCATLTVIPRPDVQLTEVMGIDLSGYGHEDWFELTNFDTNEVSLQGWCFRDSVNLAMAVVVTQRVVIHPGESVIFVKRLSAEQFASWWGADNLPAGLQIVTFDGFGIGEDQPLYFWSASARDATEDIFASYSFIPFLPGSSLYLNTTTCPFGCNSELGVLGAFQAVESPEIGSPGYAAEPPLRFIAIRRDGPEVTLKWRSVPGRRYGLLCKTSLAEPAWSQVGTYDATNATVVAKDPAPGTAGSRFYLLEQLP